MPAKSEKQAKFMRAVAHSPSFAKKVGVPMSVGKEFSQAKGEKMKAMKTAKGGSMKGTPMGKVKTAAPSRDGVATKGKTKGAMPKMAGNKGMKKGGYC
jgi:hypothetical protein